VRRARSPGFRDRRRSPFFSVLTVGVLAGGLGVAIFTFSFLYTAMIKPLPLVGGDRIVRAMARVGNNARPIDAVDLSSMRIDYDAGERRRIHQRPDRVGRRRPSSFASRDCHRVELVRRRTRSSIARTDAVAQRSGPGAEPVIVLRHWAWRVLFGADSNIVGQRLPMNGGFVRVVGVDARWIRVSSRSGLLDAALE
jgi:hypothetical protein